MLSTEREIGQGSGVPGLSRSGQAHAVTASFLGWTLDAFDYFVVVFMLDTLATAFHVGKGKIVLTLTMTLVMRPVGAVIFGMLADRYGRRTPLMANVVFFSVIELACGFAPNYAVFFILRTLYGIGMGGEWGVGASLAMESVPPRWRGIFSGILQSGYVVGNLLAAVVARFVLPTWGWRPMFWLGGVPALLALYIRARVPESEAWKQHRAPSVAEILRTVAAQWKTFLYLILLTTFMIFLSHGTQDLYPDFLTTIHHVTKSVTAEISMIYNVGAVLGAIMFGMLSERMGRRRAMISAMILALLVIPFWAFGGSLGVLIAGAFLMQAGVQGAWGIIPVHLTEMVPNEARGLVSGLAYQMGTLFGAPAPRVEFALSNSFGYQWAIAGFEIFTIAALIVILALGKERKGRSFQQSAEQAAP
ncbi:MAG: MFS transporter [Candidatus Acidiferrales bacterium]|jgi:SHS family lactate transporter-like MFS transporter